MAYADRTVSYGDTATAGTWAIAEGVVLVIVGLVAVFARYSIATALTLAFPLYLVVKGILEVIAAFRTQAEGGALWDLAFGIIAILAGVMLFARPALAGITLVAILAGYFFVEGIARLVIGFLVRAPGSGWLWVMGVGAIDVALGVYMLAAPAATLAVVAVLIGLNILAAGVAMVVIGALERTRHVPTGVTPA
ncbi:MAG TPA: DUF308 domain-containing protein [Coriobacteriia bacterium]|jgi:uncharacterized membrane protein HdeD (DUF308 family)